MKVGLVAGAIVLAGTIIAAVLLVRPTGFDRCVTIISADIVNQNRTATLDPRDVEAQAARICAGSD